MTGEDPAPGEEEPPSGGDGDGGETPRRRLEPDPDRVETLREIADDIRGDTTESEQVANLLYRVSDVYDESEDTDTRDVYVNMKQILRVIERGGMDGER